MKFATNLLRINSVLFAAFGICFIFAPRFFVLVITGVDLEISNATIDMRATYGGMGLGIGLMFWLLARQRETVVVGVIGTIMVFGAIALGRAVGFMVDVTPNAFMLVLFGAEILFAALSVFALKKITD